MKIEPIRFALLACIITLGLVASEKPAHADTVKSDDQMLAQTVEDDDKSTDSQDAQDTLKKMLVLAKAGDWKAFVEDYYGEISKLETEEQKQELVDSFANKWGKRLIPVLEKAAAIVPVIEKNKALFQVDGKTIYKLYKDDEGKWGFHL